jgi:penicillin-binding protein 1A
LNKNDNKGYGGYAAMPIWERFYKKVYADKKLGIEKEARFSKPADVDLEINNANILDLIEALPPPGAEGVDQGVGRESDFEIIKTKEYIGPESKPVVDDRKQETPKKDTSKNNAGTLPKIGDPSSKDSTKKKGLLQKLFNKKKKN